jgi:hypothetical protein
MPQAASGKPQQCQFFKTKGAMVVFVHKRVAGASLGTVTTKILKY